MRIPYARVSNTGPTIEEQHVMLRAAGAEQHLWTDEMPKSWKERDFAVKACRPGDELLVCSLWLLGKDRADLEEQIIGVTRRGAVLRCLDLDSTVSAEGLAVLSELTVAEAAWRREQTAPATRRRKAKGKLGGRPRALTDEQVRQAIQWQTEDDLSLSEISTRFAEQGVKVGRTAVFQAIQRHLATTT